MENIEKDIDMPTLLKLIVFIIFSAVLNACAGPMVYTVPVSGAKMDAAELSKIVDPETQGLIRVRCNGLMQRETALQIMIDGNEKIVYWPTAFVEAEEGFNFGYNFLRFGTLGFGAFLPPPTADYKKVMPGDLRQINPWKAFGLKSATSMLLRTRTEKRYRINNYWESPTEAGPHVVQLRVVNVEFLMKWGWNKAMTDNVISFPNLTVSPSQITELEITSMWSRGYVISSDIEFKVNGKNLPQP